MSLTCRLSFGCSILLWSSDLRAGLGRVQGGLDWVEFRVAFSFRTPNLARWEQPLPHSALPFTLPYPLFAHTCVMPPLHFKFLYRQRSYLLRLCVHFTRALEIIHKWYSLNTYAFQAVLDRS